jgi:hypothetical protein
MQKLKQPKIFEGIRLWYLPVTYDMLLILSTCGDISSYTRYKAKGHTLYGVQYSHNWERNPSQHTRMCRNQCLLNCGRCSCDLYSSNSVQFPCISTQLPALRCTEECTLSAITGFARISWQTLYIHCSGYNISKSPIGSEYAKNCRCLQSKNFGELDDKKLCRPLDLASASYQLFTENQVQVFSDNAEEMRRCSVTLEPHLLSLTKGHIFQEYWQIHHHCTCDSLRQESWS